MDGKSKLIALDHDLQSLRDVAAAMTPWYDVVRLREPMKVVELLQADANVAVVVTEQVLPTGSGVSLLESARTLRPDVRRVLMTGYGDLASIIAGLHSGAIQAMVNKPFTRDELLAAVLPVEMRGMTMSADAMRRATA
jgi:DNA-binding NtrC family response regulator